mgnify:CR=1 FL=1
MMSIIAASVELLPEPVGPVINTNPLRSSAIVCQLLRQIQ